jgi:hypothetical protein
MNSNTAKLEKVLGIAVNELKNKITVIKPCLISDGVEDNIGLIDLSCGGVDNEFLISLTNTDGVDDIIDFLEKFNKSDKGFVSDWTYNVESEFLIEYEKIVDDYRVGLIYTVYVTEDKDVVYKLILSKTTKDDVEILHIATKVIGKVVKEANDIKKSIYSSIDKVYDLEENLSSQTISDFDDRLTNLLTNLKYSNYTIFDKLKEDQDFKTSISTYCSVIDDFILEKIILEHRYLNIEINVTKNDYEESITFELKKKTGCQLGYFEVKVEKEDI